MGYRDDFYNAENIIGYTGDIDDGPTVYFLRDLGAYKLYGRITQKHDHPKNIGREEVRQADTYENKRDSGVMGEWVDGICVHPSRNPFVPIAEVEDFQQIWLRISITKFPDKKPELTVDELPRLG